MAADQPSTPMRDTARRSWSLSRCRASHGFSRPLPLRKNPRRVPGERHVDVLIIGAGFGRLCMGIKLREMGLSFIILERADDVGGTWRDNTYPGCSCDIPSTLYSFPFELGPVSIPARS
jgi:hypothetical protein